MPIPILGFQAPLLRAIADELRLPSVLEITREPRVTEVYRITVQYFDGRYCNSVATMLAAHGAETVLEVAYQRALARKPLTHPIDGARYAEFVKAVKGLRFDHMPDQPDLPTYNSTDLWLVERAAGTFSHSVILAPELARDAHSRLANAVKNGLPQALRTVK